MSIKVLFLDLDGVLNVIPPGRDDFGPIFHQPFVDNLKRIIDATAAQIVISSTWRYDGLDKMQKMWLHRGLPGSIIGVTPDCAQVVQFGTLQYYDAVERGHEIQAWLDANPHIVNYAIIDDDNDMLQSQSGRFVRTANSLDSDAVEGYGLTSRCADLVISILNNPISRD